MQRKRQKSGTFTDSSPSDISPFKCSPEEIERKKLAALAKRKLLVGSGYNTGQLETGISDASSNKSNTNVDSVNKNKNVLEEIERKKQAALKRRQDRLKATQLSSNTCQNKIVYN